MKLLFYIDTMYKGGAQRVMNNLVAHFSDSNNDVILVNDFPQKEELTYSVNQKAKRLYLRDTLSGNRLLKNIARICTLRKILKREKPDIAISFMGHPNKRLILSSLGLGHKTIVSVRNDPNREYGTSIIKQWIAGLLFSLADGCVFQTEEASNYFPENVRNKSTIIFNPVSEKFFESKYDFKGSDIIAVGRLESQKNHKLLIDAFKKILNHHPEVKLYIYGDGPLRQELEEYIDLRGLSEKIILPGIVDNIQEILKRSGVFVLPSDFEGLPNALMEALAMGVPCVSTDCPCGGPRMLITNNKNGFLVPCGDSDLLANKIEMLLDSEELKQSFSNNARKMSKLFMPETVLCEWNDYFKKVVS